MHKTNIHVNALPVDMDQSRIQDLIIYDRLFKYLT